jgi:hypothetical protein
MVPIFRKPFGLVPLAQALFFLLAAALAVFGVLTLSYGTPPLAAALMLVDAVLLGLAGGLLARASTLGYLLAVGLVLGNILAILADQFGWVDAAVLLAFVALLAVLLAARRRFLKIIHHGVT